MVATIRRFSYLVPSDMPVPATAMLSCIMLPMANSNSPLLTTGTSAWVEAMGMGRSWNPACDETTFEIAVAIWLTAPPFVAPMATVCAWAPIVPASATAARMLNSLNRFISHLSW